MPLPNVRNISQHVTYTTEAAQAPLPQATSGALGKSMPDADALRPLQLIGCGIAFYNFSADLMSFEAIFTLPQNNGLIAKEPGKRIGPPPSTPHSPSSIEGLFSIETFGPNHKLFSTGNLQIVLFNENAGLGLSSYVISYMLKPVNPSGLGLTDGVILFYPGVGLGKVEENISTLSVSWDNNFAALIFNPDESSTALPSSIEWGFRLTSNSVNVPDLQSPLVQDRLRLLQNP